MLKNILRTSVLMCTLTLSLSNETQAAVYESNTFVFSGRAGVAPSVFHKKATFTVTALQPGATLPASATDPVNTTSVYQRSLDFKFDDVYRLPYGGGFDIGYFIFENGELFANFEYDHACRKKLTFKDSAVGLVAAGLSNAAFTASWIVADAAKFGFHMGLRYFFDIPGFQSFIPFIGAKVGAKLTTNRGGTEKLLITLDSGVAPVVRLDRQKQRDTNFSGGAQLGFDVIVAENFALTFMAEAVGMGGDQLKTGQQQHTSNVSPTTRFFTNITRSPRVVSFPVTLGMRVTL